MRTIFCPVLLLLFSIITATAQPARPVSQDHCPDFRVSVTSAQEVNANTFEVKFTAEGGKAPFRYIFYDKTGQLVSEDFSAGTYKNLLSGDYQCLAVDSGHCKQHLTIHLQ